MQNLHLPLRLLLDLGLRLLKVILNAFAVRVELLEDLLQILDRGKISIHGRYEALLHVDQSHFDFIFLRQLLLRLLLKSLLLLLDILDLILFQDCVRRADQRKQIPRLARILLIGQGLHLLYLLLKFPKLLPYSNFLVLDFVHDRIRLQLIDLGLRQDGLMYLPADVKAVNNNLRVLYHELYAILEILDVLVVVDELAEECASVLENILPKWGYNIVVQRGLLANLLPYFRELGAL